MNRCVLGKFMSDDDVLLGYTRDFDEYAHSHCVTRLHEKETIQKDEENT